MDDNSCEDKNRRAIYLSFANACKVFEIICCLYIKHKNISEPGICTINDLMYSLHLSEEDMKKLKQKLVKDCIEKEDKNEETIEKICGDNLLVHVDCVSCIRDDILFQFSIFEHIIFREQLCFVRAQNIMMKLKAQRMNFFKSSAVVNIIEVRDILLEFIDEIFAVLPECLNVEKCRNLIIAKIHPRNLCESGELSSRFRTEDLSYILKFYKINALPALNFQYVSPSLLLQGVPIEDMSKIVVPSSSTEASRQVFFLCGRSGAGKTSLMFHLIDRWIRRQEDCLTFFQYIFFVDFNEVHPSLYKYFQERYPLSLNSVDETNFVYSFTKHDNKILIIIDNFDEKRKKHSQMMNEFVSKFQRATLVIASSDDSTLDKCISKYFSKTPVSCITIEEFNSAKVENLVSNFFAEYEPSAVKGEVLSAIRDLNKTSWSPLDATLLCNAFYIRNCLKENGENPEKILLSQLTTRSRLLSTILPLCASLRQVDTNVTAGNSDAFQNVLSQKLDQLESAGAVACDGIFLDESESCSITLSEFDALSLGISPPSYPEYWSPTSAALMFVHECFRDHLAAKYIVHKTGSGLCMSFLKNKYSRKICSNFDLKFSHVIKPLVHILCEQRADASVIEEVFQHATSLYFPSDEDSLIFWSEMLSEIISESNDYIDKVKPIIEEHLPEHSWTINHKNNAEVINILSYFPDVPPRLTLNLLQCHNSHQILENIDAIFSDVDSETDIDVRLKLTEIEGSQLPNTISQLKKFLHLRCVHLEGIHNWKTSVLII